ncbi:PucR-like helix-turn-helix protein [Herbihabitans rhizosphaerae]|uniref:PucR-like helix-turn-helix protein n=1 Tax=Herbihabitans rhizosphaerae TaxID=1872711 RepID=A0A4Q7KCY2_9PSEU|nr:helix-turn-helix domain-containing protein [Herbihabitans rhizosphaerae]RZS31185.1 PucR-like helix-turn-helix protein [Herbihabitans rhizosphaerae]
MTTTGDLLEALRSAAELLRTRTRARVRRDCPTVATTPDHAIDTAFDLQYRQIIESIRGGGRLAPLECDRRAPSEAMLSVGRAAITETIDYLEEIGTMDGGDPVASLEVASAVADVSASAIMLGDNGIRRPVDRSSFDSEYGNRLAGILLLGLPTSPDLRLQVTVYGIGTERLYVPFRARPRAGLRRGELTERLTGTEPLGDRMLAEMDGDVVGFGACPPPDLADVTIGIGPPRTLDRLPESFRLASRAAESAYAFGLTGVHTIESLGLLPTILADGDVGDALRRRYLAPLSSVESGAEVLESLRVYFEQGMHVHQAAKVLYLHPNTLRYRMSRFEELTGARLRDPVHAMEVWWALRYDAYMTRLGAGGPR